MEWGDGMTLLLLSVSQTEAVCLKLLLLSVSRTEAVRLTLLLLSVSLAVEWGDGSRIEAVRLTLLLLSVSLESTCLGLVALAVHLGLTLTHLLVPLA